MKRIPNLVLAVILLSFAQSSATAAGVGARQIRPRQMVGYFSNMEMSPETLDCSGYSVWLYRVAGKILGDFYLYQGGCTNRKRPLGKVTLDAAGNLSFEAKQDDFLYHFKGKLSDDRLAGVMAVLDPIGNKNISSKRETLMKMATGDR